MLGNPLWGYILDRIGVRRGMTSAVSLWTLASVAHVFSIALWPANGTITAIATFARISFSSTASRTTTTSNLSGSAHVANSACGRARL